MLLDKNDKSKNKIPYEEEENDFLAELPMKHPGIPYKTLASMYKDHPFTRGRTEGAIMQRISWLTKNRTRQ